MSDYASELCRKLNIKRGMPVQVTGQPDGMELEGAELDGVEPGAVLVFVRSLDELERLGQPAIDAAKADRIAWLAYPKAGQLGTDLNRDVLWKRLEGRGVKPVRQVALDAVWSALRFRPA